MIQNDADFVIARRIRTRVLAICDAWLKRDEVRQLRNVSLVQRQEWVENEERRFAEEKYWVLATKAEAATGLGDEVAAQNYLQEAKALSPAAFHGRSHN